MLVCFDDSNFNLSQFLLFFRQLLKPKIKLLVSYNDYFKNVSGKNGFTAKRADYFRWCEENNYQAEKLREAEPADCYIGDEFCTVWI